MTRLETSHDRRTRAIHAIDRLGVGGVKSVVLAVIDATSARYEHIVTGLRGRDELASRVEAMGKSINKRPGKEPAAYFLLYRRLCRWMKRQLAVRRLKTTAESLLRWLHETREATGSS